MSNNIRHDISSQTTLLKAICNKLGIIAEGIGAVTNPVEITGQLVQDATTMQPFILIIEVDENTGIEQYCALYGDNTKVCPAPNWIPYSNQINVFQEVLVLDATNQPLPTSFPDCTQAVYLDVDNMSADLDLTGWTPLGLCTPARVRVRKIDNTPFKITFDDGVINYTFVDKRGEYIELIWSGTEFLV